MKAWPFAALIVAVACGGERDSDLFADPGRGGSGASGGKGSGGSTAGGGSGGSGGTGSAGKAAGGKGGAAGSSGGGVTTGGTGGMTPGGSGGATGGTGGGMTAGGSGGQAGGGAMGGSPTAGIGGGKAGAGGRMTGTGGAGGSAGAGGAPPPTCDELEQAYAETFENAIACDPSLDVEQCTEHVPKNIPCGCVTHVNPENDEAIVELRRLLEQHEKLDCVVACPEVECVEPETVCIADSNDESVGRCVDLDVAN